MWVEVEVDDRAEVGVGGLEVGPFCLSAFRGSEVIVVYFDFINMAKKEFPWCLEWPFSDEEGLL